MTLEITDAMVDAAIGEHDPMVFKHGTPDAHRDHMRNILSVAIAAGEIIRKSDKADMPAVVEAMARAIAPSRWRVMDGYLADTRRKLKGENASYDVTAFKDGTSMAMAQAALSAALATGSVVICSPIEKALIEDFRDLGSKDAGKMARLMELLPRYRAFIEARAHQETK